MRQPFIRGLGPPSRALFTPLFVLTFGGALLAAHAIMETTAGEEDAAAKKAKKGPAVDLGPSHLHGGITGTVTPDDAAGNGHWWEPAPSSLEKDYRDLVAKAAQNAASASWAASFREGDRDSDVTVDIGSAGGSSGRHPGGPDFFASAQPLNLSRWVDDHPGVLNPPPLFHTTHNSLRSSEMPSTASSGGIPSLASAFGSGSPSPRAWNSFFAAPSLVSASTGAPTAGFTMGRTSLGSTFPAVPSAATLAPAALSSGGSAMTAGLKPMAMMTSTVSAGTLTMQSPSTMTASVMTLSAPSGLSLNSGGSGGGTTTSSTPAVNLAANINYEFVPVGNPGNANDSGTNRGFGAVNYTYDIGKYDVTLTQYTVFLNAVAKADPFNLYNTSMASDPTVAGIQRTGASGNYSYSVIGDGQRPVTYVSWFDAARFANWVQNGQPTGVAETAGTTETGAYTLNGQQSGIINKNANAQVWIPTESEWYKAAYYDPTLNGGLGGYWQDATKGTGTLGNTLGNDPHQANFFNGTTYSVGGSGGTTAVGAFGMSVGAYGTFDQSGNVYNWTDGTFLSSSRIIRGGAWDSASAFYLSSADRGTADPGDETADMGFRLAMVPEPAGWLSLATGAALLLGRRRRKRMTNDE